MKNLYISCCDIDGGIMRYTFENGVMTHADTTYLKNPMYTVADGDTLHIIVRELDDGNGGSLTYRIANDGRLYGRTDTVTTHGVVPCHHCIKNGAEYVVNYVSGSIVRLPDKVVTHAGRGIDPIRQEKAHTHFVTVAPDGNILCTDLGIDRIVVYDDDLNEKAFVKLHDGAGPRHLVFSQDGKTLYCANELEPSVSVLSYDGGRMEIKNTYPLPDGTAAAIRIFGEYLYVSVRASDCIVRFKISGDELIEQEITDVMGVSPRDFNIVDGHIICANERSDNVTVFELDDGRPIYKYSVNTLKTPLCVTVL